MEGILVRIAWAVNPFRGDKFEEAWAAPAEAVMHYGATAWGFLRSKDDPLKFEQFAVFPSKQDFERYWFSEEIADARVRAAGYYQVPVLPTYWYVKGVGRVSEQPISSP